MLSLLGFLKGLLEAISGGESPAVPANVAPLTSTSTPVTNLVVTRTKRTGNALFGKATIGNEFVCYTMERTAVSVPIGTFKGCKRFSAHLNRTVIGIDVPGRTDIEGHDANYPCQLDGCIAFGLSIDGDALDSSVVALEKVLSLLPDAFTVEIVEAFSA